MEVFSTITSPVFSELVLIPMGYVAYLSSEFALFEALRKMHKVRPFKLAFLLENPVFGEEKARLALTRALESVAAKGLLDFLSSPPTIRSARCQRGWEAYPPDFDYTVR